MDEFFTQNANLVNLDSKVSPAILAKILGVNISLVYQEATAGRLPSPLIEHTYMECIQQYVQHFKKNVDVKLAKQQQEHELALARIAEKEKARTERYSKQNTPGSGTYDDADGSMHPLVAEKVKQAIKLDRAREEQIFQRMAIERKQYVDVNELGPIVKPFVQQIRELLLSLATDYPEMQGKIDEGMEALYNMGTTMLSECEEDSESFVEEMISREI